MTDLLPMEDERQIHHLYARYCHGFAHGSAQDWVDIFAADGVFEKHNPSHGGLGTSAERVQGHADLMKMILGRREKFRGQVRHQQTDILLSPGKSRDEASGVSLILVTDWRDGSGRLAGLGHCTASVARGADGWRFTHLLLNTLPKPAEIST